MKKELLKSILGGICIGLGGLVYLAVENKYVGSFLFSLGLLTILTKELNLYTGKIYSLQFNARDIFNKLIILLGNYIGATFVGIIAGNCNLVNSIEIINKKFTINPIKVFILSILCGILMYLAVSLYKHTTKSLFVIMPVMTFILIGAEHCIADMFYFSTQIWNINNIINNYNNINIIYNIFNNNIINIIFNYNIFIIISILGNSIGGILFYRLEKITH